MTPLSDLLKGDSLIGLAILNFAKANDKCNSIPAASSAPMELIYDHFCPDSAMGHRQIASCLLSFRCLIGDHRLPDLSVGCHRLYAGYPILLPIV